MPKDAAAETAEHPAFVKIAEAIHRDRKKSDEVPGAALAAIAGFVVHGDRDLDDLSAYGDELQRLYDVSQQRHGWTDGFGWLTAPQEHLLGGT
ncbi:MAG: hypothetical protein FWH11_04540 [Micrococcales bacterium]|nr:hypothetical protein [Micrococcales bacterium]